MKINKLFAALTAIVLAAANSSIFTPAFFAAAEEANFVQTENDDNCTVSISLVDITTGKNIEGVTVQLEQNPLGTGIGYGSWNTSDEPVKTFTDLDADDLYSINILERPDGYSVPSQSFFSFDHCGEVKDYVIRAVPNSAKRRVSFYALDWTNAIPTDDGNWFKENKEYKDYFSVVVYDEEGKRFTSETLGWGNYEMYLPDGKYKINVTPTDRYYELITEEFDLAKTAKNMLYDFEFPDKNCCFDIEVVDGKLTEGIVLCVRMKPDVAEHIKEGCKANISIVDFNTNEPLKGVKARFITDIYSNDNEVIGEWDTTDESVKSFKDLRALQWYAVEIIETPEGYHIDKRTAFNFSQLGDTENVVIKAVPNESGPNVNVAVYDWTDLVVDPADGTYKGYKELDPAEYSLCVFTEELDRFDVTDDLHLPDGKYRVQISFSGSKYHHVDNQGWKARAVRKIFGKEFVIPESISTDFEIKDGKTVGQPCLFVEKWDGPNTSCTLNLQVVDGVTGKAADAVEYEVVRIAEEYEDVVEKIGIEETKNGFLPAYGKMPESGSITVKELEPYVKYAVIGRSGSKHYGGADPVFITFDKDGESKDVTIKLMPFDYKKGDLNGDSELSVADLLLLQKMLLAVSDTKINKPEYADFNEDGIIDVFDLITLRKELIKNVQEK